MKFIFTLTITVLFFATSSLIAQLPRSGGMPQAGLKASILGVIKDSSTSQVLEYATVTVKSAKTGKTVNGAISKSDGKFLVDKLKPQEEYNIEISFIGYQKKLFEKIMLTEEPYNMGVVMISPNSTTGNEVEVTAKKEFQEIRIDKKVYNLSANPTFTGSNLNDALSKLPAIEVDQDGNISLRGKGNPTILMDGRPVPMSNEQLASFFKQMPTNMIETIEVVTNPSAKYEASGMSGIINIVTKKNNESSESYGGGVVLGYGTNGTYSAFLNGNYKRNGFSAFASAGYSKNVMEFNATSYRENRDSAGISTTILNQTSNGNSAGNNINANTRLDYNFTPKTSVSISGMINNYSGPTNSLGKYDWEKASSKEFVSYSTRTGLNNSFNTLINSSLSFKHQFEDEHNISLDANYSNSNTGDEQNFTYENFAQDKTTSITNALKQRDDLKVTNKGTTLKIDYSLPLSKNTKIETGFKGELREIDNKVVSDIYNDSTQSYMPNAANTKAYLYNDKYAAVYGLINQALSQDFSIQAGLRVENTNISGGYNGNTELDKSFLDFFPSASVLYKISDAAQIQLGYSKRIQRPRFEQLLPFTSRYDVYNRYMGNPNLNPEYTHAVELNYSTFGDWGSVTLTPFIRVEKGSIRHVSTLSNNITTTTQVNFGNSTALGSEFSISTKPVSWLSFTLNLNASKMNNDGSEVAGDVESSAFTFGGNLNAIFSILDGFDATLSSRYRSRGQVGYSRRMPHYSTDATLSYRMFFNSLIASLRFNDVFDTQRMAFQSDSPNFFSSFEMKNVSRFISLNLIYNFGQRFNMPRKNNEPQRRDDDGGFGM